MQSLAVFGPAAADIAERDTLSAFDPGSAFERLLELDFKLLAVRRKHSGCRHDPLLRTARRVPYRFWKDFQGQVYTGTSWETRTYRMFARDLQVDPRLDLAPAAGRIAGATANGLPSRSTTARFPLVAWQISSPPLTGCWLRTLGPSSPTKKSKKPDSRKTLRSIIYV